MVWMMAAAAFAQEPRFDGQVFRPSADAQTMVWTEDTHDAPDGYATARAYLQYAGLPVRWKGADGDSDALVSGLLGIDALGALRWKTLRLGVDLPLYVIAAGELGKDRPGLGDIAFDLKGTVLPRDEGPVGVALMGRLMLPTSTVDVPLGSDGTGWELQAIVDRQLDRLTLAANLGTRDLSLIHI